MLHNYSAGLPDPSFSPKTPPNPFEVDTGIDPSTVRNEYVKESSEFEALLKQLIPLIKKYTYQNGQPDKHLMNKYIPSKELCEKLECGLKPEGESLEKISQYFETAFKYSLRTSHPMCMKQLVSGSEPVGQLSELVAALLNSPVHVYGVSPVFSVTEVDC